MPYYGVPTHNTSITLQSTCSAATSGVGEQVLPHHPITCTSDLSYDENGIFACMHASTPADDPRTQSSINHSIVLLVLEPAILNQEWHYKTPEQLAYEWLEKYKEEWK